MRSLATAFAIAGLVCSGVAQRLATQPEAGTIRGLVLGPEGHAVPGVLVATTHPESALWRDVLDADSVQALTGLDGRFELRGALPGKLRVVAYARDCPPGEGTLVELPTEQGITNVEVPLSRPSSAGNPLRVRVLDPEGQPVKSARLVCTPRPGCEHGDFARPDEERTSFEIQRMPGECVSLRASPLEYPRAPSAELLAPAYAFDVPADQRVLELRLAARPARTLVVTDEQGAPVRGFTWQVLDEHQFRRRDTGAIQRNDFGLAIDSFSAGPTPEQRRRRWAMVDVWVSRDRALEQFPLPSGPFLVQVLAAGFEPAELGPFDGTSAPAEIRFVLRRSPEISGLVLADGMPVAGATVRLLSPRLSFEDTGCEPWPENVLASSEELYDERTRATTAADGSFRVPRSDTGRCLLRVGIDSAAEVDAGPFELSLHESRTGLRIELPHRGAIAGKIRTRPGREIAGKFVLATRNLGRDPLVAAIAADGSFQFAKLAPGRWTLRESSYDPSKNDGCRAAVPDRRPAQTDPFTCEVRADETTRVELDLTRPVRFTARVELSGYEKCDMTLTMWSCGSTFAEGKFGQTNDTGHELTVEFDQPGEYQLTLDLHRFPFFERLEVQEKVVLHEGENTWCLGGATGRLRVHNNRPIVGSGLTLRDGSTRILRLDLRPGKGGESSVEDVPAGFWHVERRQWNDPIVPDVVTIEPGKTAELVLH